MCVCVNICVRACASMYNYIYKCILYAYYICSWICEHWSLSHPNRENFSINEWALKADQYNGEKTSFTVFSDHFFQQHKYMGIQATDVEYSCRPVVRFYEEQYSNWKWRDQILWGEVNAKYVVLPFTLTFLIVELT